MDYFRDSREVYPEGEYVAINQKLIDKKEREAEAWKEKLKNHRIVSENTLAYIFFHLGRYYLS